MRPGAVRRGLDALYDGAAWLAALSRLAPLMAEAALTASSGLPCTTRART